MLSYVTKNKQIINIKRAVAVLSVIALFCSFNNANALTYNDKEILGYKEIYEQYDVKTKQKQILKNPIVEYIYLKNETIIDYKDIIFNENSAFSNTKKYKNGYIIKGQSEYYKDQNNKIWKIDTATTTLENYTLNLKLSFLDYLIKPVKAESYYTYSDGGIYTGLQGSWTNAHDATSGTITTTGYGGYVGAYYTGSQYEVLRTLYTFDTSSLPNDKVATANFYVMGAMVSATQSRQYNIYNSNHSDTITGDDFDLCGTTALSTAKNDSSWGVESYNNFSLATSSINVAGYTKFCLRDVTKDVNNSAPSVLTDVWIRNYQSYETGTNKDPYLFITIATTTESTTTETISTSTTTMIDMTNVTFLLTGILIWIIMMTGIFFYKQTK